METVKLGFWEMDYNEPEDAIRLLVNGGDRDAVLLRLTKDNIVSFLSTIDNPETDRFVLEGQPMQAQEWYFIEEGEDGDDDYCELTYRINEDDLTKFHRGDLQPYTIFFAEQLDRRVLSASFWEFWGLDHILAETTN